jgi:hypothetical protein
MWSATTRIETSERLHRAAVRRSGQPPNGLEQRRKRVGFVGRDLSLEDCRDPLEAHPVSIEGAGSGFSSPPACRSNSMKTLFQIST